MSQSIKIVVYGIGGVGGYFGGRLCQLSQRCKNLSVTFVVSPSSFEVLHKTRKLVVESTEDKFEINDLNVIKEEDTSKIGVVDYVLLTTKTFHVAKLLPSIVPLLGKHTLIIPLQNGMDTVPILQAYFTPLGHGHTVGVGTCKIISFKTKIGHIKRKNKYSHISLGELTAQNSERTETLKNLFNSCEGVHADIPENMYDALWSKFIVIISFSSIGSVLSRVPLNDWLCVPETRNVLKNVVKECVEVANAHGQNINYQQFVDWVVRLQEDVAKTDPTSTTSIQRDFLDEKPTEMEDVIGSLIRLAKQKNINVPTVQIIYALLKPQELYNIKKNQNKHSNL